MNPVTIIQKTRAIVYDADALPSANEALFDLATWRREGGLVGEAPGRGTTHFIEATFGLAVLRRYLRGGWAAKFSRDRYVFTGVARSRPFHEFHLLAQMHGAGLRVPAPLAALCQRGGFLYRGALLTRRIENARPLPERFADPALDWHRLGADLREFHAAGVDHADLNARNILVQNETGETWLLDFDRSGFTPGVAVDGQGNLDRLLRSLRKLWPDSGPVLTDCWARLVAGYGA